MPLYSRDVLRVQTSDATRALFPAAEQQRQRMYAQQQLLTAQWATPIPTDATVHVPILIRQRTSAVTHPPVPRPLHGLWTPMHRYSRYVLRVQTWDATRALFPAAEQQRQQIGRAPCRERVQISTAAVSLKKKHAPIHIQQ